MPLNPLNRQADLRVGFAAALRENKGDTAAARIAVSHIVTADKSSSDAPEAPGAQPAG